MVHQSQVSRICSAQPIPSSLVSSDMSSCHLLRRGQRCKICSVSPQPWGLAELPPCTSACRTASTAIVWSQCLPEHFSASSLPQNKPPQL